MRVTPHQALRLFLLPAILCLVAQMAVAADGATPVADLAIAAPVSGSDGGNGGSNTPGTDGGRGVVYGANHITVTNSSAISGGDGGDAGTNAFAVQDGDAGGNGGEGVIAPTAQSGTDTTTRPRLVNQNGATISGGDGGRASDGGSFSGNGGTGGNGADGVRADADYMRIDNVGTIIGGDGGTGGDSVDGDGGDGGAAGQGIGITGDHVSVSNDGIIANTAASGAGGTGPVTNGANGTGASAIRISGGDAAILNDGNGHVTGLQGEGILLAPGGTAAIVNHGVISATDGIALRNGGTVTSLANTGTIEAGTGIAIRNNGNWTTLDNSGGIVRAGTGQALVLDNRIATLTGGLLTASNISGAQGTVVINSQLGAAGQTFGNTIIENASGNNAGIALNIRVAQLGTITNAGTIRAFGAGNAAAPTGIAINLGASIIFNNQGTIQGNIVDGGNDMIVFSSSGHVTGNIILNGNAAHALTIAGGVIDGDFLGGNGEDTLNLNGGTFQGNLDFGNGPDILNVNQDFTTGGTVTGGQASATVNMGAAFTVDHPALLNDTNVANGAGLYLRQGDVTTGGIFSNNGMTRLGAGRILSVQNYNAAAQGAFTFDAISVSGVLTTGRLDSVSTPTDFANQAVSVNYSAGAPLNNGARSLIASGTGIAVAPVSNVTDNSSEYDFRIVQDALATNELYLEAIALAAAGPDGNDELADILQRQLSGSDDAVIAAIRDNLANAATREEFDEILESTRPATDGGTMAATMRMMRALFELGEDQFADDELQAGGGKGVVFTRGLHVWSQSYGDDAAQEAHSGVDGYQATSYGAALGVDTRNFRDDTVIGLALGAGYATVLSDNASQTQNDIETYQAMAYLRHDLDARRWGAESFVTAMLAGGVNTNLQTRYGVGFVPGADATAIYQSWQAGGRATLGRHLHAPRGIIVTPSLRGDLIHYVAESYAESGAGGASLAVDGMTHDSVILGGDLRASWPLLAFTYRVTPHVHAGLGHDILHDDRATTHARFAEGGAAFSTPGLDPGNAAVNFGAGVTFYSHENWDMTARYDYSAKSGYDVHSGFIRAAYAF